MDQEQLRANAFKKQVNTAAQTLEVTEDTSAAEREMIERWREQSVPKFLEDVRGGLDLMAGGEPMPESELRPIVESDYAPVTTRFSAMVDPAMYSSLQTQINSTRLMSYLKAGKLKPRGKKRGSNYKSEDEARFGVYLELHRHLSSRDFDWGDVELHFDYSLLDRHDYHLNPGWSYGWWYPLSASPAVNPGRVAYYLQSYLKSTDGNEVVFSRPVPLSALVKIVVRYGTKAELLRQIRLHGLKCPVAMGWEELIVESTKPAITP